MYLRMSIRTSSSTPPRSPRARLVRRIALATSVALGLVVTTGVGAQELLTSPPLGAAPTPEVMAREYRARREALLRQLPPRAVLLAFGSRAPAHDYESFAQAPSFFYLTGLREQDAALVVVKSADAPVQELAFVLPNDPAREIWNGARLGVEGVRRTLALPGRLTAELDRVVDSLAGTGAPFYLVGDFARSGTGMLTARSADLEAREALQRRHPQLRIQDASDLVLQLRGRKSETELALLRQAIEITVRAQREAMRAAEPGMNEFELQALVEYTFRRNGAQGPSFGTIIGSGPNSTTLHYNADDRFIVAGDMIVMDIGASYRGYAADVTRTIPVSGTFSPEQRAIYQIVRDAQRAAEQAARPGALARLMSDSARAVISRGLARLGLIESATAQYDCEPGRSCAQTNLFYMHGLGHGIGLEVHDPDQYERTGTLAPGSAFTIEPGIYVRADVLDVLPDTPRNREVRARLREAVVRYRNIGVRIEDDYIVTPRGLEWVSRAPREIAELEAIMREPWTGPAPRDATTVDRYRGQP